MTIVYLGLGANLNQPSRQLREAVQALSELPQTDLVACSSLYASRPMGPQDQPDYVNAVAAINTHLTAHALLQAVQGIENAAGRVREQRWGPRTLDIDLLLYGEQVIQSDNLTVPHPGLSEREFVLIPLAEIAPTLTLPNGLSVAELAAQIARNGLDKIAPPVTMPA